MGALRIYIDDDDDEITIRQFWQSVVYRPFIRTVWLPSHALSFTVKSQQSRWQQFVVKNS